MKHRIFEELAQRSTKYEQKRVFDSTTLSTKANYYLRNLEIYSS